MGPQDGLGFGSRQFVGPRRRVEQSKRLGASGGRLDRALGRRRRRRFKGGRDRLRRRPRLEGDLEALR